MPACIVEHVAESVANLSGRFQNVLVVAVSKHGAFAPQQTVDALGDPNAEALDTTRQALGVLGLANQMQVVPQHGPIRNAESFARAAGHKGLTDYFESRFRAHVAQLAFDSQRDMNRVPAG